MKIAVIYDFENQANISREGIGVFAIHLLNAIMKYCPDTKLEFWTYSFNVDNVKLVFKDIFQNYSDRIEIFSNNYNFIRHKIMKTLINFKILRNKIKYILFKKEKYKNKINYLYSIKENEIFHDKMKKNLIKKIKKYSKADVCYSLFVSLKLGKYFNCPKFVQVHDLFTIQLFDLFKDDFGRETKLKQVNNKFLNNLQEYAEKDSIFISSSNYVAKNHSLKYIPNIKKNQVAVCPFPPMIKDFDDIEYIDKQAFKSKYGIGDLYMAYPSQNRSNKNWIVILEAIKILRDKGINIQFATTGKICGVKKTEEFIKNNNLKDLIVETGSLSVEELYYLYKYSDLVVVSTVMEGMGISGQCLEALKVGNIPVIHTKSIGIEESLKSVGLTLETADLNWFDLDDSNKLANLIEEVLKDPKKHIEKQKHILEAYTRITWKDVANNYINLFKGKLNN